MEEGKTHTPKEHVVNIDGGGEDDDEDGEKPEITEPARSIATSVTNLLQNLDFPSLRKYKPTICKVPEDIRRKHEAAFDPKSISIGPFHRGKPLYKHMENIKLLYLQDLLDRSKCNKVEVYAAAILSHEEEARRQYSEPIALDSEEFVKMLVIDGCFIVEFLLKRAEGKVRAPLKGQARNIPTLRHDLLLVENQIPFFILRVILKNTDHGLHQITLLDLALHYLEKKKIRKEMLPEEHQEGNGKSIYHLLHLHHLCVMHGLKQEEKNMIHNEPKSSEARILKELKDLGCMFAYGLLFIFGKTRRFVSLLLIGYLYFVVSVFEMLILWKWPTWHLGAKTNAKKPRMIPTATQLKEAGVIFSKKEGAKCYLDVTFIDGKMEIPLVHIQENSHSDFRNLLALEQNCPDIGNNFTSYVVLMDNLIDTAVDVGILKRHGIIESKLGSDESVAEFFNGIRCGLCFTFDEHYLVGLFEKVNRYYNLDHNRWRAKLVHEYFSNPWTIFSLMGAIILLGLTAVQTAYTIKN